MGEIKFTSIQIEQILDGRLHSPIQDVVGDDWTVSAPLPLVADTKLGFQCNGNVRNFKNLPSHITNMWDEVNNKVVLTEFLDTPEIVANVSFIIDPTTSSEGIVTVSAYVNETIPILIKSVNTNFKGITEKITSLLTFYAGDATGFDIKNKGVIFTLESTASASVYDNSIEIYRT